MRPRIEGSEPGFPPGAESGREGFEVRHGDSEGRFSPGRGVLGNLGVIAIIVALVVNFQKFLGWAARRRPTRAVSPEAQR